MYAVTIPSNIYTVARILAKLIGNNKQEKNTIKIEMGRGRMPMIPCESTNNTFSLYSPPSIRKNIGVKTTSPMRKIQFLFVSSI
jgi:hypothetical protein